MEKIINNDKTSTTVNVKVYKGNSGKRKALLHILDKALSLNKPSKLYIVSQEDMMWLVEDQNFVETLKLLITKIITMGHKLVIIHNFDRSQSTLLYIMTYWIPVHLSGFVEGYYLNTYTSNLSKTTMFILEDYMCAFSYTLYNTSSCDIMFEYTDHEILQLYQDIFNTMLISSQPLGKINLISPSIYFNIVSELDKKTGCTCLLLHSMYSLAMPPYLYERILSQLDIPKSEQKQRLNLYKARFNNFIENLKLNKYSVIICSNVFEEASAGKSITYWGADFFEKSYITVEYKDFAEHVSYLRKLAETMHNLELFFIDTSYKSMNMPSFSYLLKENDYAAIFNQKSDIKQMFLLKCDEFTILRTFRLFHNHILEYLSPEQNNIFTLAELVKEAQSRPQASNSSMFNGLLTRKEYAVAQLLLEGMSTNQIAEKTFTSKNTVKSHVKNIYRKLEVTSKYEFINRYS